MKIVVVSDLHLDKETIGVPRMPEVQKALLQASRYAIDITADAFVCLGDVTDPDSGGSTMWAVHECGQTALHLREAQIPSIWIAGNHDVFEDGSGATVLSPLEVLQHLDDGPPLITIVEDPTAVEVGDVLFSCLPFTPVSRPYSPMEVALAHRDVARRRKLKLVVLAHLMIAGITPGSETTDMPRGREVLFPTLHTADARLRLNGHYHRRQIFDPRDGGPPIVIPGSPAAFAFGEHDDQQPGFLVIEL